MSCGWIQIKSWMNLKHWIFKRVMVMSDIYCFTFIQSSKYHLIRNQTHALPLTHPCNISHVLWTHYIYWIWNQKHKSSKKLSKWKPDEAVSELVYVCGSIWGMDSSVSIIFIIKQYLIMISFIQILFQMFPMWVITIINRKGAINVRISQCTWNIRAIYDLNLVLANIYNTWLTFIFTLKCFIGRN